MDATKVEIQSETDDKITLKKPLSIMVPNWKIVNGCTIGPVVSGDEKRIKICFEEDSGETHTVFLKRYLEDQESEDFNEFIIDEEKIENQLVHEFFMMKMGTRTSTNFIDMLYHTGVMEIFEDRWPHFDEPID